MKIKQTQYEKNITIIIRNMNQKLKISHSRIVDLLQVLDISCTIDIWAIREQRAYLKCVETQDPDCEVDHDI